jgi:hypothetical protein
VETPGALWQEKLSKSTLWRVHLWCFCGFLALHVLVILDSVNDLRDDRGLGSALHGNAHEKELPKIGQVTSELQVTSLWILYFIYGAAHILEEVQQFSKLLPSTHGACSLSIVGDVLYTFFWLRPNLVDLFISFLFVIIGVLHIEISHADIYDSDPVKDQLNFTNITTEHPVGHLRVVSVAHLKEWSLLIVCFMTFPLVVRLCQRCCIFERFGLLYVATWETIREDVSKVQAR